MGLPDIASFFLSKKAQAGASQNAIKQQEAKDAADRKAAEDAAKAKAEKDAAEKKVKEIQFAVGGLTSDSPLAPKGAMSPLANGGLSGPNGMLDYRNQMAAKGMKKGGTVKSRGDGIAQRGKTKGRMV